MDSFGCASLAVMSARKAFALLACQAMSTAQATKLAFLVEQIAKLAPRIT